MVRVMVAEEDEQALCTLKDLLKEHGCEVVTAGDGAAALEGRARELEALNTLAQQVSASLSLDEVVSAAIEQAAVCAKPDLVMLFLRDGDDLVLRGGRSGEPDLRHEETPVHHVGECLCGLAVSEGVPMYSTDIRSDSRCTWAECKEAGFRSFAALPICSRQGIIGVLGFASASERDFSTQGAFLEALANEVAIGVQNALLHERTEQYAEELSSQVTQLEQAQQALRRARQDWEDIFQAVGHPAVILDPEHRIVVANRATVAATKTPAQDLVGKKCHEIFHNSGQPPQACPMAKLLDSGEWTTIEMEMEAFDGTFLVSCTPVLDENGTLTKVIHIATDITQRKQAEKERQRYEHQLRSMASELSLVEERERRRLATELHDSVGQVLATAKIRLDGLRAAAGSGGLAQPLAEVWDLVDRAVQDTRSLTFELSPPVLYELGLEAAVAWLAERAQVQHGLTTSCQDDDGSKPLTVEVRTVLFGAVRELLFNVAKHAQAAAATISLSREGESIRVEVGDDGVGFDPSALRGRAATKGGFGLFSIRERLTHLGGQFTVESQPGQGTRVTLTAPLAAEEE